jgi:hypothetical protein
LGLSKILFYYVSCYEVNGLGSYGLFPLNMW